MSQTMIAAQLWTIREAVKTPAGFAESMKRLRDIGYRAVQPNFPIPFGSAGELREVLEENGLACCATHYPADAYFEDIERVIADHKTLGCTFPGVGGAPRSARSGEGIAEFGKRMHEVCARLAAHGQRFVYHNHHWEFQKHGGRTWIEALYEAAPEEFCFELDLYWVQAAGADPVNWIRRCSGRCPVIHLKDMGVADYETVDLPVGEGNLDWPAVLEAARGAEVRWYVVEEDHPEPGDGFDSLARSFRNLRSWGLE